ncbi:ROK family protein [Poriferisphaera corsica]|uniref:ROK family protein n=1 Tax=Poriferisphaera corsica TaxID=2528020 RepID=UPI00190C63DD|nr:ROK family protein [Poriferisphaera corsica]
MKSEVVSIGIDIGGTNIKAVCVDDAGVVLERLNAPSCDDVDQLTKRVIDIVNRLDERGESDDGVRRVSVGISSPGLVARDHRSIRWMRGRLEAVEGLDWSEVLGRDVFVLNDAHAATMGEAWVGAASDRDDVVLLTLGTGVGGGVIMNGRLLEGAIGRAGHLGHICMDVDGERDIVKMRGSFEDLIGDHTVEVRTGYVSTAALVTAVESGERGACEHWERWLKVLACGVASLINVFDPEVVVIGGGISKAGRLLFDGLAEQMDEVEWRPLEDEKAEMNGGSCVEIMAAELGDMAGAVGVARFAMLQCCQVEKKS